MKSLTTRTRILAPAARHRVPVLVALLALSAGPIAATQALDAGAALRAAASRGEVEQVRALLAAGAAVDSANEYGATPLMVAANRGRLEVVETLLAAGANVALEDGFYERTALAWATEAGFADVIAVLFVADAGGFDKMFQQAVEAGDVERVSALLALQVPAPEVLSAALERAIRTQNRPLGELLFSFGAEPPPPEILKLDPTALERFAGRYIDEVGFELEVEVDLVAGVLLARPPGMRNALRFVPVEPTTFIAEQSDTIFMRFSISDGRVVSMAFNQGDFTRRMMKQ